MSTIDFSGRVAVVTGAGRGIGRSHALELARRGAAVVVNDYSQQFAQEVVGEIQSGGGKAIANYDSVATAEGGANIVKDALARFGKLDVLINNAGILRPAYFENLTLAEIDAVLDSHLRSCFFVTQPAWRHMKQTGYGRIIMTSSSSGLFSHQGLANYAAAKAGVYGLTKALAYEGAQCGIKTNVVLPYAQTTISKLNPIPDMLEHRNKFVSDELAQHIAGRDSPDMIAHLVAYLASEGCEPNGEAFSVCAGRYGRVFVGVADGWLAPDPRTVSAEAIAQNLPKIRDITQHTAPMWLFEECADTAKRLAKRQ